MALTRRQFMTLTGGSAAAAVIFAACGVPEDELLVQSPVEMPEDLVSGRDNWYATLCRECGGGEGVVVRVMEGRAKKIEGNVDFPTNAGKHSARCEAGLQALYNPDRIRGPLIRAGERGAAQFEEVSWTDAASRLAYQLQNLRSESRQRRVVIAAQPMGGHVGYVMRRFIDEYGATYVPFEPLDTANLKSAVRTVFGQDRMPDFDIANAGFILSFGADFLNTWGAPVRYSRGYGEFRQGDRERGTHYHVDSRFSMTAANADKWIPVKPGTEGLFALSVAQVLAEDGLADAAALDALTGGERSTLDQYAPSAVADRIGVSADTIHKAAHEFGEHGPSIAFGGGSAAAHTNGEANLIAIYSLNHLAGSVGAEGGIRFNPPPPLDNIAQPASAGSIARWRTLVNDMRSGRIDALIMAGADPFYALPGSLDIRTASYDVPLIASFSDIIDDSAAMADIVLPRHAAFEDWGTDSPEFGPGYQTVGFQQPVVRPFFENRGAELGSRGLGDAIMTIARMTGLDLGLGDDVVSFKDVIRADARRLHALGRGSVRAATFGEFWNGVLQRGGWWDANATIEPNGHQPPALAPFEEARFDGENYGFYLTPFSQTGIGEGQRAHLPWMQATPDPITTATWRTWIEINARVAENLDIREGDVIKVTSPRGSIEALAFPHPGVPPDTVSLPFGQGHANHGRYAKDRGSNVFAILAPLQDTQSGAFAWAATKVNIEKTDEWVRVPKFENTVPFSPVDEDHRVYEVTETDS